MAEAPALLGSSARLGEAGISLRPAVAADDGFLRLLHHSIRWDEFAALPWPDEAKIAFLDQQRGYQQRHYELAHPEAEQYVVACRDVPVGRLYLDRTGRALRVVDIGLLPDWRGRALGTALLEMLQDEVRAGRAERIDLMVLTTSPARRLYARLGFREVEEEREFPPVSIEMVWRP